MGMARDKEKDGVDASDGAVQQMPQHRFRPRPQREKNPCNELYGKGTASMDKRRPISRRRGRDESASQEAASDADKSSCEEADTRILSMDVTSSPDHKVDLARAVDVEDPMEALELLGGSKAP